MPFPLIAWLVKNSGTFTRGEAYSYDANGKRFYYYLAPVTTQDITNCLAEIKPDFLSNSVFMADPETLENSLHFILSGNLFKDDPAIHNEFSLRQEQFQDTTYYQLHPYTLLSSSSYSREDSNSDSKDEGPFADETDEISIVETAEYFHNHKSLHIKTVKENMIIETQAILEQLLAYFTSTKHKLIILKVTDRDLNTILLRAFNGTLPYVAFKPLLQFIQNNKKLPNFDFAGFALATDILGCNIFHYMSAKVAGFCADIFGEEILLEAFTSKDQHGYTPLHHVCELDSPHKLADIQLICNLLLSTTMPVGEYPIENPIHRDESILTVVFQRTTKGNYSPCHLLCICASETDISIINYLRLHFPEILKQQLTLPDRLGNLPSHYAIKSRNLALLQSLLINVTAEEQVHLLMHPNRELATGLDYAISFSNEPILKYIIGIIGYDQLYEYCNTHPTLAEQARESNRLLADRFSEIINSNKILYECTAYFLRWPMKYNSNNRNYRVRLDDFITCLNHIKQNKNILPPALAAIQYDTNWLFFKSVTEYYEYRKVINKTMQNQLKACKNYFHRQQLDDVGKKIVTTLFGNPQPAPMQVQTGGEPARLTATH